VPHFIVNINEKPYQVKAVFVERNYSIYKPSADIVKISAQYNGHGISPLPFPFSRGKTPRAMTNS
jgi:hypothetical protein